MRTNQLRFQGILCTILLGAWGGLAGVSAQTPVTPPPPPPQLGHPGAGKVLGLPTPDSDKTRRSGSLILPGPRRQPARPEETTPEPQGPVTPSTEGPAAMADFVASLTSAKALSTAELVAEYSLLSSVERKHLLARAHRLPAAGILRLARVFRAVPDTAGVPPLLTVLRSRELGKETAEVVEHVLFLSGPNAKLVAFDLLESRYKGVRHAAAAGLVGLLASEDVPQLNRLLGHKLQGTRLVALDVLAQWLAANPTEDLDPLVRCLRHPDGSMRAQAARWLGDRGETVVATLLPGLEGAPEDDAWFLSALLVARRELLEGKDLLPASCQPHLARHRLGVKPLPKAVAALVAAMREFRDQAAFRASGSPLAALPMSEIMEDLLSIVDAEEFYPEFPVCHDAALLCLRLLSGEDFAANRRRWRGWWDETKADFEPLHETVVVDHTNVMRTRIGYSGSNEAGFWLLGRDADEPAADRGGFRCRLQDADLLAAWQQLREDGFLDLAQRLRESKQFSESHRISVEGPGGRAQDGFVNDKSLRLRVFLRTIEKILAREFWQEFVPQDLDLAGRKRWWQEQARALGAMEDGARRAHVLDLALDAFPKLGEDARRRTLGRFLEEASRKDGELSGRHAEAMLSLLEQRSLGEDESRSVFEVLALMKDASFVRTLSALSRRTDQDMQLVLRRMLALAGPDRILVALQHESPVIRAVAAGEVVFVSNPKTISILVGLLEDPDWSVRQRAAESCGRLRLPEANAPLKALLTDPEPRVRASAVVAIARIGAADTYQLLLHLSGQGEPADRLNAVRGLTMLRDTRVGPVLVQIAAAHYGTPVGMMALQGLQERGGAALRAYVLQTLQGAEDPLLRRDLAFLLAEMQDPAMFTYLLGLVEQGDSAERSCRLLASITGVDYCERKDRVRLYRDWWTANGSRSPATWLIDGLARENERTPLRPEDLVPGAGVEVVDELCRLVEELPDRLWALRALAGDLLREVTLEDFGPVRASMALGARQSLTEQYRTFVRGREAVKEAEKKKQ